MATTRLTRTLGTPTNRKKLTASMWLKKSFNGTEKHFFGMGTSGGYLDFRFANTGELELYHYNSGYQFRLTTTRKFRDTNAWYHLVFTIDTTLGTADDRFKVYVNGVQETVFTNRTNPSQDYEIGANASGNTISVGNYGTNTNNSFDGIISHVHFSDGYAYDPTPFGETDSATGEWKIKTSVTGVTYGNNGFWWLKDTIATTDHSSNSNTFTVGGGTLTKTEDCPSNVFCTINPLFRNRFANQETLTNGNTTMTTGPTDGDKAMLLGTIGVTSGKWYWECKVGTGKAQIGFAYNSINRFTDFYGSNNPSDGFSVYGNNGNVYYDGTNTAYGSSWTTNDIIMVALDMDNKLAWLGKNGTWFNSATQTEIENGTATYDLTTKMSTKQNLNSGEFVFPMFADMTGTGDMGLNVNFGNGYFGTTAVSSAGTNASGIGIFEYDVPANFTALSTKGLNL